MQYQDIQSIEDAQKLLQQLTNEESTMKSEIRQLIEKSRTVENRFRKVRSTVPNMTVLRDVAEHLRRDLEFSCTITDKTSSKVKKMDLITRRVEDCLTRVADIEDLKKCTEGIQFAQDNEEYENAALIVQRFLKIDENELIHSKPVIESDGVTSMEDAFRKLHDAKRKLQEMVMSKFDESVKDDDVAMVERFFKLFPFLNQEKEGLKKFSNYLSTKIHDDVTKFMMSPSNSENTSSSSNTPSHPEQLGNLFQVIAKIIDVHQPLIETYYKHGNLLFVIEILQKECDRRSKRILDDFKTKRNFKQTIRLIQKSIKANMTSSSSWSSSNVVVKVDPRDLDILLAEMIFITSRSETYLKFLRRRITDDFFVAYPDPSSPDRIDSISRLESFVRDCELARLIQELSGHYVLMEEYFLRESIVKAIEIDEESIMSTTSTSSSDLTTNSVISTNNIDVHTNSDIIITSNLLDDVFFIVKKCIRRATSSGNMDVVCAIINHSITVLETTYLESLHERIKYGYPNTLASAAANLDLSQAYNALQSGRYLQSSTDLEKTKRLFLTTINNLDASSECITTLKQNVKDEVSKSMILSNVDPSSSSSSSSITKQSGKLDSCLLDLSSLTSKFHHLLSRGLHQMYVSLLKPRLKLWIEGMLDVEHELSDDDVHELTDGLRQFTSSFLIDIDSILKSLQPRLTQSNFSSLVDIFSSECASRVETAIFKCSFNRLGSFQLDREVRSIVNYVSSISRASKTRDKFSRLRQIVTILNVELVNEITDYITSNNSSTWRLSSTDIRSILKLRTDLDRHEIRRLRL